MIVSGSTIRPAVGPQDAPRRQFRRLSPLQTERSPSMDTMRLCACIVLLLALLAAEIYLSREVIAVAQKLLDPPGR